MTEQETSTLNGNEEPSVKGDDDNLADDSWLIYLSRDLGKVFRKGKDEIDILVDSSKAAYATTQKITKKMAKNPKVKRYSPYSLAGNGVLFLARSSGKVSHIIESGTESGLSKIEKVFRGKKKYKLQAVPLETEESVPEVKSEAADLQPKKAPSPSPGGKAPDTKVPVTSAPKVSKPTSVTEKKTPQKEASSYSPSPGTKAPSTKAYKSVTSAPKVSKPVISAEKKTLPKEPAPAAGKNIHLHEAPSSLIDKPATKTYKSVTPSAKVTSVISTEKKTPPQKPVKAVSEKIPPRQAGKTTTKETTVGASTGEKIETKKAATRTYSRRTNTAGTRKPKE